MRLLLSLLGAAVLSLAVGLTASGIAASIPCQGEGLACNLDNAIGAYAVLIWSALGPLVFAAILLLAKDRVSLASGIVLLLAPLIVFTVVTQLEAWQTIGLEPYRNFRQVMTMFLPAALTVVTQWLVLRYWLGRGKAVPPATASAEVDAKPTKSEAEPEPEVAEPIRRASGFDGFPTE